VGHVLRAAPAQWSAHGTITVRRQWLRCGRRGARCQPIQNAAGQRYRLRRADLGRRVRVREVASVGFLAGRVASAPTRVIRQRR
jgi:hypothetical protein